MSSALRVGLIGCGEMGCRHVEALHGTLDACLTAVYDLDQEAARAVAKKYEVPHVAGSLDAMWCAVDAVIIATPSHHHAVLVTAALSAGKHVLCEKPLTTNLEELDRLSHYANGSSKVLQVGLLRRFDPAWRTIEYWVRENSFGRPLFVSHSYFGRGPAEKPWYFDRLKGGGPFIDCCVHTIDFALRLFGLPTSVYASVFPMAPDSTAPDVGTAMLKFSHPAEVSLTWNWGCHLKSRSTMHHLDISGPDGYATVTETSTDTTLQADFRLHGFSTTKFLRRRNIACKDQMSHFIRAASGETAGYADIQDARKALQVSLAILRSSEINASVSLEDY